ncbi:MAG: hypothetical protein ACLFMM_04220 [Methanohalobium sp.]|uniref:hypothetical protein n=1 Tax=Methanohalobium sp. TaxID=2837493 RepID=UPI00397B7E45
MIKPQYNHISQDNFKHRIKNEMEFITRDQEEAKKKLDEVNNKPGITGETDETEKSQRLKTIEDLEDTVNRLYDKIKNIKKKNNQISESEESKS